MDSRGRLIRSGLAALAASLATAAPALGAAVTYQGDNAHTGNVAAPFKPPLGKKWIRRDLGGEISYPVIGDGKVFVTARESGTGTEAKSLLYALDRRTGGTVWVRPVLGTQPAFDNGRVFVAGSKLQAYDSGTGKSLWLLEPDAVGAPPVADGTTVFAAYASGVNSFEEVTGAPVASSSDGKGSTGAALDGPRVYGASGCEVSFYTKALGEPGWTYDAQTCTGGGSPPAVFAGRVWAGGASGVVLDENLGLRMDSFSSWGGPAFAGNLAYFRGESQVQARRIDTGTIAWTYSPPGGTYSSPTLAGSLLFVNGVVYTVTGDQQLIGLDAATGATRGKWGLAGLAASSSSGSSSYYDQLHGMAADSTGLVVPTGSRVVALGPGGDAPHVDDVDKHPASGTKMSAHLRRKYVYYPGNAHISGAVSHTGTGTYDLNDRLELQASTYPYEVWRTVDSTEVDQGNYSFSNRPDRNTRYRVVDIDTAPAVVSKVMRVTLFIGGGSRYVQAGRNRIRATTRVKAPPWLKVDKGPLFYYRLRSRKARWAYRVARAKLHRTGAGRYRARATFRAPHLRRTDLFYACTHVRAWHEIGRFKHKDTCGRKRE